MTTATLARLAFFLTALTAEAALVAEPAALNLGRRSHNITAEGKVVLRNNGTSTLNILSVSADCSCTAGQPAKTELQPGETTELVISSETRTYRGDIKRNVYVRTQDSELVIPVSLLVTPYENWQIEPAFLVFKPSKRGEEASLDVAITHLGPVGAAVRTLTLDPPFARAEHVHTDGPKSLWKITKSAEAPAGNYSLRALVETTDTANPRLSFEAYLSVVSSLQLRPNPVVMPSIKTGGDSLLSAVLSGWVGPGEPLVELAGAEVNVSKLPDGNYALRIKIAATEVGAMTRLLRISTATDLELEVPVILRVTP